MDILSLLYFSPVRSSGEVSCDLPTQGWERLSHFLPDSVQQEAWNLGWVHGRASFQKKKKKSEWNLVEENNSSQTALSLATAAATCDIVMLLPSIVHLKLIWMISTCQIFHRPYCSNDRSGIIPKLVYMYTYMFTTSEKRVLLPLLLNLRYQFSKYALLKKQKQW